MIVSEFCHVFLDETLMVFSLEEKRSVREHELEWPTHLIVYQNGQACLRIRQIRDLLEKFSKERRWILDEHGEVDNWPIFELDEGSVREGTQRAAYIFDRR